MNYKFPSFFIANKGKFWFQTLFLFRWKPVRRWGVVPSLWLPTLLLMVSPLIVMPVRWTVDTPKIQTPENIYCNHPKIWTKWLYHRIMCLKNADRMANKPPCDKTNKMICVPSEDSDQTGPMPRLIWVFPGHTCHFVGFVMMRLKQCRPKTWPMQ